MASMRFPSKIRVREIGRTSDFALPSPGRDAPAVECLPRRSEAVRRSDYSFFAFQNLSKTPSGVAERQRSEVQRRAVESSAHQHGCISTTAPAESLHSKSSSSSSLPSH